MRRQICFPSARRPRATAPYIIVIKSLLLGGFRRQTGLVPRAGLQGGGSREGAWPKGLSLSCLLRERKSTWLCCLHGFSHVGHADNRPPIAPADIARSTLQPEYHHFLLFTPQVYLATTTSPRWPEGGSSSYLLRLQVPSLPCLARAALSSHPQYSS